MKRSGLGIWFLTFVLFLGVHGGVALAQSFTQGDDPLLVTPEVFVIVDTSGSMTTNVTDPTTGNVMCESNSDGSTCYNCNSSNICSKCVNSSGTCASVSGFSNSGNTDPITGRTLCESSSVCSKCTNTSGSCASVSGYSDSNTIDPATGHEICTKAAATTCSKVTMSGTCTSVTGYTDSGFQDAATGYENCWKPAATICSKVNLSGSCQTVSGYTDTLVKDSSTHREICSKAGTPCSSVISGSCQVLSGYYDTGKQDSSTGKELCVQTSAICSKVITTQGATSGTCGTGGSGYTKSTQEATTGRYWCTKSGKKYLDCSPSYLDCSSASTGVDCVSMTTYVDCSAGGTCVDCTACLDCSSTCYDSSGNLLYESATALTRQTAVRQVLTGNYNTCGVGNCGTCQRADGILDVYKDVIRFGFGTYDDDRPYQGNICGSNSWNYPAWGSGDSITCSAGLHKGGQVGLKGRNQGTGSLIDLVDTSNPNDLIDHNNVVQSSGACTTTASGSTPLNAALWDARYYYQNWQTETGYNDLMDQYGCRAKFVLLLTDGEDNGPTGYEYASAAQEAANLYSIGIPTYVVGFGDDVAAGDTQLNAIQQAGSGCPGALGCLNSAFFAQNPSALLSALQTIMNSILAGQASRTTVVSAPSTSSSTTSYSYQAWMQITSSGLGWRGHLVRKPVTGVDSTGLPIVNPDTSTWIYFENILAAQSASARNIYTVVSDPRSQTFSPINRPMGTDPVVDQYPFMTGYNPSQLQPLMCLQNTEGISNATLMDRIRDYVRGVPGSSTINGNIVNTGPYLGDIFHSNPLIVQPPSALTLDFRYEMYFQTYKNRPSMVYVGANDGMLHAFIGENTSSTATDPVGKELWAFIPTNLLSNIQQTRLEHSFFVDGSPMASDVLFQGSQATDAAGNPLADSNHNPIMGAYRTVLISGERAGGSAYFALDVTDPYHPRYLWEYRTDVPTSSDYTNTQFQCRDSELQSWSSPIIGEVWLKNARPDLSNGLPYQGRSVMIVPGGYLPPQTLTQASSCVEFMEGLSSATSIHVVDIETGKLLKKVMFSNSITGAMQTAINNYYNIITTNNCYANPGSAPCKNWSLTQQSSDYGSGTGWSCSETRASISHQLPIPAALLVSTNCTTTEDASHYEMKCCDTPPTCSTSNSCYYDYYKNKTVTGGITVRLITDNCTMVNDPNDRGHYTLQIENNFLTESVAATGAAQDTSVGQYITRVFMPTTSGKIYRIDLTLGKYDPTAAEGNMISAYTDPGTGITYNWDVGRNPLTNNPEPWYDTIVDTAGIRRPIMVSPAIALDYDLDLILFFGSGVTDNLEYSATRDYIWAVKEGRTFNSSTNRYDYDPYGTRMGQALKLSSMSERLFSKPLVLQGDVYFSTYTPITSACVPGIASIYGKKFTDLSQDVITKTDLPQGEPAQGPTIVWTPAGPAAVTTRVGSQKAIGKGVINSAAHVVYWGRVL